MKKIRLTALTMAGLMAAASMTGCGAKTAETTAASETTTAAAEVGAFFHALDVLILFYKVLKFRTGNFHVGEQVGNFDEKFCLDAVVSFRACSLHSA